MFQKYLPLQETAQLYYISNFRVNMHVSFKNKLIYSFSIRFVIVDATSFCGNYIDSVSIAYLHMSNYTLKIDYLWITIIKWSVLKYIHFFRVFFGKPMLGWDKFSIMFLNLGQRINHTHIITSNLGTVEKNSVTTTSLSNTLETFYDL